MCFERQGWTTTQNLEDVFFKDGNVKIIMPEHYGSTVFKKITINARGELEKLLLVKANFGSNK